MLQTNLPIEAGLGVTGHLLPASSNIQKSNLLLQKWFRLFKILFLSFPSEQLSCTSPFFVPSFHFFAEIPCSNFPPLVQMSLDCRSALAQKD